MNLISGTHHSCKRREHAFIVLREYIIISRVLHDETSNSLTMNAKLYSIIRVRCTQLDKNSYVNSKYFKKLKLNY